MNNYTRKEILSLTPICEVAPIILDHVAAKDLNHYSKSKLYAINNEFVVIKNASFDSGPTHYIVGQSYRSPAALLNEYTMLQGAL